MNCCRCGTGFGLRSDPARRSVWRAVQQALVVTAGLGLVLMLRLPYQGLALRLWLIALGAIAISGLTERTLAGRTLGDGPGLRVRWGWWRRPVPERIRALVDLEHAVEFSLGTAFDVHYRLRPHLRRIVAHRLAGRGVILDGEPERVRALLGPDAWELVRPDRPEPPDRSARGLDLPTIRRTVEQIGDV